MNGKEVLATEDMGQPPDRKRGNYSYIQNNDRYKLLHYVWTEKTPVVEVCQILNMKYTSAKSILSLFEKTGRITRAHRCKEDQEYFKDISSDKERLEGQKEHMLTMIAEKLVDIMEDTSRKGTSDVFDQRFMGVDSANTAPKTLLKNQSSKKGKPEKGGLTPCISRKSASKPSQVIRKASESLEDTLNRESTYF
jgi:hypothetical protein